MRIQHFLLTVLLFTAAAIAQPAPASRSGIPPMLPPPSRIVERGDIRVPVYEGFETLLPLFTTPPGDTLRVINFWATWCRPCVEELPYFEELTRQNRDRPLQVILISLDLPDQLEKRLLSFIEKQEISSAIAVLDDPDANSWIDRIDPSWGGAIPATLFLHGKERIFREQSFSRSELHTLVDSLMEIQP